MDEIYRDSLKMHKKFHGKLSVVSKVPLKTKGALSRAYTPGVAAVCLEISKNPDSVHDLTIKKNTVAIVSDGSAILGLGNLGAEAAIPVMEGKAALLKEFAGVDAFPICLSTQNTEEIIKTVMNIAPVFGAINLEDIAAPRCFEVLDRLRESLSIPVMHDDQQGTAAVVLAGLINSFKLKKLSFSEAQIVINGAGAAGTAIAQLLLRYGAKRLVVCDSVGIIYRGRKDLNQPKEQLARHTNPESKTGGLAEALVGADVFIGVSKAGVLNASLIKTMAKNSIIFALANPVPEIMPKLALQAGAFVVATGRSDFPNQINNVLMFPGIFRGVLDGRIREIDEDMLIRAAEALARATGAINKNRILPSPLDRSVAKIVAKAVQKNVKK